MLFKGRLIMKTIICIQGARATGKTPTIRGVYKELVPPAKQIDLDACYDFSEMIDYNGTRIGITSYGDPGVDHETTIQNFIDNGCELVLCACRSRGGTQEAITRIAHKNGYHLLFASAYKSDDIDKPTLNAWFVDAVLEMIDHCLAM